MQPPWSPPPSAEAVNTLLTLPDLQPVLLTTQGFRLDLKSLETRPGDHANTFTLYVADKLSGMNSGNCDGDLLAKFYAAAPHKEEEL